jgi:hypothetical protein
VRAALIATAAVLTAAVLLLVPLPDSWSGAWQGHLQDLGHVPLFAGLTIALHAGLRRPLYQCVLIAVGLAALAEVVQGAVGRSGSWPDLLRGALGALAGAALVRAWAERRFANRLAIYLLAVVALVAWPVLTAAPHLIDAAEGHRDFPTLAAFETDRELVRWVPWQATLDRVEGGARLVMQPGPETYPCASLRPVQRDFRGHRWLCAEFTTEGEPYNLYLSMRTGVAGGGTTHVDVGRVFPPGRHRVRLDLDAIGPKADPVPLELDDVRYVQFFVVKPKEPRAVLIHRVWLE